MPWPVLPLLCAAMVFIPAVSAIAWTEREIVTGGLSGTLTVPATGTPAPAALIWPGSGPVNRNGNLPGARSDMLRLLAHRLAEAGIATLRIDKRGIGASGAGAIREETLTIDTSVADAVAWIDRLGQERAVSRTALIGHSEGALVATLAAQRRPVAALILIAGASEPAPAVIARQLAEAGVPEALRAASAEIASEIAAGRTVDPVPPELAPLYRPSVQPYLASWFVLDPTDAFARTDAPALIIQGGTDLQATVADAERLAAARPATDLMVLEGMNHVLKAAPAGRAENLATYSEAGRQLAPELVKTIAAFLHAH